MASSIPASAPTDVGTLRMRTPWLRVHGRRVPWLPIAGVLFIALLGVVAAAAPWLAPQDPIRQSLRGRLSPPTLEGADGRSHLFGTDHLGRDVLSRVIYGSRVSLVIGFSAVVIGGLLGSALGMLAGFAGSRVDGVIMTLADAQLAFPFILLAIGIIAVLGPSFPTLVVVIGLSGWVSYARILRSQVLVLRSREFVEAIHALGGSVGRVVLRHVLPNVMSSIVVVATLELARSIVLEATLSFLGLGIQPPTPSWGGMIQEGRDYLDSAWWISTFPGIVLMLTSIVVSRTGDGLRDLLDPTLRGVTRYCPVPSLTRVLSACYGECMDDFAVRLQRGDRSLGAGRNPEAEAELRAAFCSIRAASRRTSSWASRSSASGSGPRPSRRIARRSGESATMRWPGCASPRPAAARARTPTRRTRSEKRRGSRRTMPRCATTSR